jgi:hypothetical protein
MIRILGHTVQDLTHAEFHDIRRSLAAIAGFDLNKMVGFGGTQQWLESESDDPLVSFINRADSQVTMMLPSEAIFTGYRLNAVIDQLPQDGLLKHLIALIADNLITSGISDTRIFFEPRHVPA